MAKGEVAEEGSRFVGVIGRAKRERVAEYCKPADLVIAIGYDPIEFNYEEWFRRTSLSSTSIRSVLTGTAATPPPATSWGISVTS